MPRSEPNPGPARPLGRRRPDPLGTSLTWLSGASLALSLLLIVGLLVLLAAQGLGFFWQGPVHQLQLADGTRVIGEITATETVRAPANSEAEARRIEEEGAPTRTQLKIGNRDLYGLDFRWIDDSDIVDSTTPADLVMIERLEWGAFFGRLRELRADGRVLATGEDAWREVLRLLPEKAKLRRQVRDLEKGEIGDINHELEELRLAEARIQRAEAQGAPPDDAARARIAARRLQLESRSEALAVERARLQTLLDRERAVFVAGDGRSKEIGAGQILRALRPNAMTTLDRLGVYAGRVAEFLFDDPRESNTEGGIFPAIFGTVLMVFLMTFVVTPLGVLAALYLREYAVQGTTVRLVRIAVNNLAGVPSIVFGMFGLSFFVYLVGGSIDRLFYPEMAPTPKFGTGGILWAALTLALLTVPVVIVATEEGLAAVPRIMREGSMALGATKLETTLRVVVPAAAPGILTGMILAIARAAGEVAPLMIVGMVKLAPSLPLDHHFPHLHLDRKFMHLGFHIYDVGFQSPNVEATRPLVFATAFFLVLIVTAMNLLAISIRNHLRRKYATSAV
ncbi:MAG: phosphate ABC transporter permease PstA [Planctomycetes bacterium]|nr:phosphate ABC transporter permease PstA [Planctomycetota bacterium]